MRTWFLLNIVLTLVWVALSGEFGYGNYIFGYVLGYFIIWVLGRKDDGEKYVSIVPKLISFMAFFIWQVIIANLLVAFDVVTPHNYMTPGIVRVPLDAKGDFEITLLANFVSLTPGTLSLDVSTDKKVLYVHSMYIDSPESFIKNIKNGFERRLLEILR
jgi:multicomponent Na+:H+ antiporter subunit E